MQLGTTPAAPPVAEPEVDLESLTKDELLEVASERGVEVASRWTKARILEALA